MDEITFLSSLPSDFNKDQNLIADGYFRNSVLLFTIIKFLPG